MKNDYWETEAARPRIEVEEIHVKRHEWADMVEANQRLTSELAEAKESLRICDGVRMIHATKETHLRAEVERLNCELDRIEKRTEKHLRDSF